MTHPEPDERPEPAPEETPGDQPADAASAAGEPWPELDPAALKDKHFMTAGDVPGGLVAVTASEGPIERLGAPSGLFARLADQIGTAIKDVGNLLTLPLVVRAQAGSSMTIVFGDPILEGPQATIPYYPTLDSGDRIAELIRLEGDQLFHRALQLGAGSWGYVELVHLVESEGITLDWEVRGRQPQRLTPGRASEHHERLTVPPQLRERRMEIEGLLYRVIYDGPGKGRAGIKLSKYSALPPRRRGRTVVVRYDDSEVEGRILHELIGHPVIAWLQVHEVAAMTSIVPAAPPYPLVESIRRGRLYEPMELLGDEDDDDWLPK